MTISKIDVEHLAKLAKLSFTENEKEKMEKNLTSILEAVEIVQEIDTEKFEATYYVNAEDNSIRKDSVQSSISVEKVLQNAPHKEKNYFKIPKVL